MAYKITQACTGCGTCEKICPTDAIEGDKKEPHSINSRLCIECGACGRICPENAVRDSSGRTVMRLKKSLWPKPVIDRDKCYACENCVVACPADALSMYDGYAILSGPRKCVSCGWCFDNCQFGAITMEAVIENN